MHNVIETPHPDDAVLSRNPRQHPQNFATQYPTALDQARHHPYMLHHPRIESNATRLHPFGFRQPPRIGPRTGPRLRRAQRTTFVQRPLLPAPRRRAVVGHAPSHRLPPSVRLPTAERTEQILTLGIARIGQKENPAVPAPLQAPPKLRLPAQNRSQNKIVPQDQVPNLVPMMPSRAELEMLLDFYGQKPRFSLITLMLFGMSPSYLFDSTLSRGRMGTLHLQPVQLSLRWVILSEHRWVNLS